MRGEAHQAVLSFACTAPRRCQLPLAPRHGRRGSSRGRPGGKPIAVAVVDVGGVGCA